MHKDFDQWFKIKSKLEERNCSILFKEGEVWWCSIGVNTKQESCGKGNEFRRPVLILKRLPRELCIVIPSTSKTKSGSWFYRLIITNFNTTLQLHQIKCISSARLASRISSLNPKDFEPIKRRLKSFLF